MKDLVYAGVVEKAKEADSKFEETRKFRRKFNESFRYYNLVAPRIDSEDVKDLFIEEIATDLFNTIKNASTE